MAHELPYIAAIDEAIKLEMARDETVLYFGQNMATTENEPYVDAFGKDRVRVTPISDDNPVVYLHHYLLTLEHGEVPDGEYLVPFGQACVRREGGDVTIVATGWMVDRALGAAGRLASEGVDAEVIDPRTLAPLDMQTILESVDKTGRLVLVDQATRHASAASAIAGEVAEHGFSSLKAPIVQVTALDATIPYSEPLEAWV